MKSEFAFPPESPGDVLRERLGRHGITQDDLADALGVSRLSVNQLINGRRAVTSEMALRLAHVLDTSAKFWLELQMEIDLFEARRCIGDEVETLRVLRSSPKRQK